MGMQDEMAESTISLPSLLIFAGISYVLYRFFFAGGLGGGAASSSYSAAARRRFNPAAIEQVAVMFPQLDRRAIAWDLHRNGGNAQATVERMLMTGRLDTPPQSFQPPGLTPPNAPTSRPGAGTTSVAPSGSKLPLQPNLIARYKLESRVKGSEAGSDAGDSQPSAGGVGDIAAGTGVQAGSVTAPGKAKAGGWASNKTDRAAMMQARKEEMILRARRNMEQQDRRESKGKAPEKS